MPVPELLSKRQCNGEHERVHASGKDRTRQSQAYTQAFCDSMSKASMEDKKVTARRTQTGRSQPTKQLGATIAELSKLDPHEKEDALCAWYDFFDDISGMKLDHRRAAEARALGMDFFRMMRVYGKVPREEAIRNGGKIITTRWLGVNKGDGKHEL